jgi:hypothetical protein
MRFSSCSCYFSKHKRLPQHLTEIFDFIEMTRTILLSQCAFVVDEAKERRADERAKLNQRKSYQHHQYSLHSSLTLTAAESL